MLIMDVTIDAIKAAANTMIQASPEENEKPLKRQTMSAISAGRAVMIKEIYDK